MNLHLSVDILGIAAAFLLLASSVLAVSRARRRSRRMRVLLMVLCLAIVLVPVGGIPVFGYLLGVVGEVSVTLTLLLACALIHQMCGMRILPVADLSAMLCTLAIAGLILYPSAMGLVPIDIYRLGYRPTGLLLLLMLLALWAWASKRNMAAFAAIIAIAAFDLHLAESDNLWDYLTDPLATFWAWGWVLSVLCAGVWRRTHRARRLENA
ncbi:MAG: hypothetical protein NTX71_02085 [Candidatus Aureabacteria bacterium]|nr:hypothetical protein [Candidatus Auribacterota bacterium]